MFISRLSRLQLPWGFSISLGIWFVAMVVSTSTTLFILKTFPGLSGAASGSVMYAGIDAFSYFVGQGLAIALVVYLFRRNGASFFGQISLNLKSLNGDFNRATRMACLTFLGVLAFYAISYQFIPRPESASGAQEAALQYSGVAYLVFLVMGVIIAPIMEEVLDRGFLFNACRAGFRNEFWQRLLPGEWLPDFAAIVLSAALFSASHLSMAGFYPVFIMGIAHAALYRYSGSLVPSMILHFLVNLVAFLPTIAAMPK